MSSDNGFSAVPPSDTVAPTVSGSPGDCLARIDGASDLDTSTTTQSLVETAIGRKVRWGVAIGIAVLAIIAMRGASSPRPSCIVTINAISASKEGLVVTMSWQVLDGVDFDILEYSFTYDGGTTIETALYPPTEDLPPQWTTPARKVFYLSCGPRSFVIPIDPSKPFTWHVAPGDRFALQQGEEVPLCSYSSPQLYTVSPTAKLSVRR